MRITNNVISRTALLNLQRAAQGVHEAQNRASTGKRIQRASDDPTASASIMTSSGSLRALEQYRRNINSASARLDAEELALDQITGILTRAKELGLSQGSSTADAQTRLVTKSEVDQLLKSVVSLGNTQHAGEFLFGGDQSATAPFQSPTAPYSAVPPTGTRRAEISSALYVKTNHNGTEVFLDTGVLAALEELSVALGANDQVAIQGSLVSIDSAMAATQTLLGDVGAQQSQLDVTSSNLTALDTSLTTFKSSLEDEDVEKAVTELISRQTAYQAAMLATSRVIGLNLADYLR